MTAVCGRTKRKPPKGVVVDHIGGNGLNNCKSNLRVCRPEQNEYSKSPRGRKSRFKGVRRVRTVERAE